MKNTNTTSKNGPQSGLREQVLKAASVSVAKELVLAAAKSGKYPEKYLSRLRSALARREARVIKAVLDVAEEATSVATSATKAKDKNERTQKRGSKRKA